ncbi:MAG TPA: hotdog fold thioesterase [Bacteroidales bacterium]|jgi:acyl-CoA thioesterase|nr:hotdog fold thioesterase [Bacteroidales bacterium]HOS71415.1 hotdog fold thioesterase [Bacteroidales bacterium]HQH23706.1 hotdog fold thioesterase [Bacteroidales bacterium]HQJ82289.1 hotdog fold thioesterase [Bacteroidales bacterium]
MDTEEFLRRDHFASLLGIELFEAENGKARASLKIGEKHLNGLNMAHGGAIFGLADLVFAAASNSYDRVAVGIHADIYFLRPVRKGEVLTGEASELSKSDKLATYAIKITNDQDELIASFRGMVYRKKESLERKS